MSSSLAQQLRVDLIPPIPLPRLDQTQTLLNILHHVLPERFLLFLVLLASLDGVLVSQPSGLELGRYGVGGFGEGESFGGLDLVELHAEHHHRQNTERYQRSLVGV